MTDNPFQPPEQIEQPPRQPRSVMYVLACLVWSALAIKFAIARPLVDSLFLEFEVAVPMLTQWLLHPMSTVLFFAIAAAVILAGLIASSPTDRQRVGRIAVLLAIIAVTAIAFGLGLLLLSLINALS
jgi:hypothetical protein